MLDRKPVLSRPAPRPGPYPPPVEITLPVGTSEVPGSTSGIPSVGADGTIYTVFHGTRLEPLEYCGFSPTYSTLYAFNPDGSTRWKVELEGGGSFQDTAPAIQGDGTVLVGVGQRLISCSYDYQRDEVTSVGRTSFYAINSDGTIKWRATRSGTWISH
jgi:outer membrane protein assembly factor BamB